MDSEQLKNINLSIKEVLEFCIKFEEITYNLYSGISRIINDPQMKEIFLAISEEEIKHRETFTKMLHETGNEIFGQKTLPEHIEFLLGLLNSTIFSKEMLKEKMIRIRSVESSFEFLISVELDQVLLYNEIRDQVADKHKYLVDEIISEERRHFVRVMQLKQTKYS